MPNERGLARMRLRRQKLLLRGIKHCNEAVIQNQLISEEGIVRHEILCGEKRVGESSETEHSRVDSGERGRQGGLPGWATG